MTNNMLAGLVTRPAGLAASLLLSGCVGLAVGVLGDNERDVDNPRIQVQKGSISAAPAAAPWITAEDLRRYWGAPDAVTQVSSGTERWQYNFGTRWNGVGVLIAFVPLPLVIPVGHEYIEFTVANGAVVKAKTNEGDWVALYGCVASAIPHATGTDCVFGGDNKHTRFVREGHPFKVRIINATPQRVSIALRHRLFTSGQPPFTLEARESRNVLEHFLAEVVATTADGKALPYVGREPEAHAFDASIVYLIARDRVFPLPPKYWDSWEANLDAIAGGKD